MADERVVLLLVFAAVSIACYLVVSRWTQYDSDVAKRLSSLSNLGLMRIGRSPDRSTGLRAIVDYAVNVLRRVVPSHASEQEKYQREFRQAGLYARPWLTLFLAAKFLLMGLPPLIAVLAVAAHILSVEKAIVAGSLGGLVGFMLPGAWLTMRIKNRGRRLRSALPDFLDLLVVCIESGLGAPGALLRVSEELQLVHPHLAMEMNIVNRDIALGDPADKALRRLADRSGEESIRMLSTFVREARRFGTALSSALREHADMIRTQREQKAEEQAQKAAVKILLPTLLLIFPTVFVVLVGPAVIQIQQAFSQ
jgi:tight adherence protein C